MSAAGRALSKALDVPGDWDLTSRHRIVHKPTSQGFWIANGAFFFDGEPEHGTPKCLGLVERHWLYAKARRMGVRRVVERFEKEQQK